MDRLLAKRLIDETTAEEREEVDEWVDADPAHQLYADDFRLIWERSRRLAPPGPVDEEAAWERFVRSGKMGANGPAEIGRAPKAGRRRSDGAGEGPERPKRGRISLLRPWPAVAAAAILAVAIGVFFLTRRPAEPTFLQTQAAVRTDTLPDGSRVTLNKHSSLDMAGCWTPEHRMVKLKGEGFFEVVHEVRRPFIVEINGVMIRDLGTSFNVRSADGGTEVIVESGAIMVTYDGQTVKVNAGEKVIIGADDPGIRKMKIDDQLYQYYRRKHFEFHDIPLKELVVALNVVYDTHIVVHGPVSDRRFTGSFSDQSLDSVLLLITKAGDLTIKKSGDSIILKER
jgi:ferric-dicitrate binding protein FerR (iron transport regulator)